MSLQHAHTLTQYDTQLSKVAMRGRNRQSTGELNAFNLHYTFTYSLIGRDTVKATNRVPPAYSEGRQTPAGREHSMSLPLVNRMFSQEVAIETNLHYRMEASRLVMPVAAQSIHTSFSIISATRSYSDRSTLLSCHMTAFSSPTV